MKDIFSIITVTKRKECIKNLIENYTRQSMVNKELIVIINNDNMSIKDFYKYKKECKGICIHKVPQSTTLGECINIACKECKGNYIAKFDDDDYYGKFYLKEAYDVLKNNKYSIVGKYKIFYYLEEFKLLGETKNNDEYKIVESIKGSTICFKKEILKHVRFRTMNCGEDITFIRECKDNGYKIYATSKFNHIVYRSKDYNNHTWKENSSYFINQVNIVKKDLTFKNSWQIVDKL